MTKLGKKREKNTHIPIGERKSYKIKKFTETYVPVLHLT